MINNFEQIKKLLVFDSPDDFYHIQILQRVKENPQIKKNSNLVKTYCAYSTEYLDKKREEIIKLCEIFNARAYISLNRRNSKIVALEMMSNLADSIRSNEIHSLNKIFDSTCGKHHSEVDKKWIIDIDSEEFLDVMDIEEAIKEIEPIGDKTISIVPTKNGWHIISKPFNSQVFGQKFPTTDVQKNAMTILYIA